MLIHSELKPARQTALKSWAPPPVLTVSEWTDKYRYLSPESSAEPGKWYTERAEYQRGIMDAVNDPDIETIVVMSSTQVGKTEIINNIIGYFISQDPSPILVIQPNTKPMAETWSKDRLAPMVRDTPILRGLIKPAKSRDSDNTLLRKSFPGGRITMTGANSPASLAARPIRILAFDEVDEFPPSAGSEGDPVDNAIKRTDTFWNRITIMVSSPTIKDLSRIEAAWDESDQRRFFIPCYRCQHKQYLQWGGVVWVNRDPKTARYKCEKCGAKWTDARRWNATRSGEWRSTAEDKKDNSTAGFHLNSIYSPWVTLQRLVKEFYHAKGNRERMQVFVNKRLAELFEEEGLEMIEPHFLMNRRENYPARIPAKVLVLTCGADVQDDRIELEVVGWGKENESWNIDYHVIHGNPAQGMIWKELEEKLDSAYQHESGIFLKISCACVDTGGHFTQETYNFCKGKEIKRIFAIKGSNTIGSPLVSAPVKKSKAKVKLFMIGTDTAKQLLYSRLKITEPGPGYMHFPMEREEEYFNQITAEKPTTKYTRGFPHRVWVKKRPRNEALDCRVYSMAALIILNPNYEKIALNLKKRIEKEKNPENPEEKPKAKRKRKKGSWLDGH